MTKLDTTSAQPTEHWRDRAPHVRKALAFIRRQIKTRAVTAEDLVAWDRDHGRKLFRWDDKEAAEHWRLHEARLFLNRFRGMFEGMRMRAFIHIAEDPEAGITESGYVSAEAISEHVGMREQVIADITRRMKMLASELRMWRLSEAERTRLFDLLAETLADSDQRKSA